MGVQGQGHAIVVSRFNVVRPIFGGGIMSTVAGALGKVVVISLYLHVGRRYAPLQLLSNTYVYILLLNKHYHAYDDDDLYHRTWSGHGLTGS